MTLNETSGPMPLDGMAGDTPLTTVVPELTAEEKLKQVNDKIAQTLAQMAIKAQQQKDEAAAAPLSREAIALALCLDNDGLARAVWGLAMVCEDGGNRGFEMEHFKTQTMLFPDAPLCVGLLTKTYDAAWNDILFYVEDGRGRRGDYSGWGVRRKPPWWKTWFARYGQTAAVREAIDDLHAAAQLEDEARQVARKVTQWGGHMLDDMETSAVAYAAAMLDVLAQRYRHKRRAPGYAGYMALLATVYHEGRRVFLDELAYRVQNAPIRPSKKKTETARRDWYAARGWIERGTEAFFSAAFIAQAVTDDAEPILSVDMEQLPRMTREESPVRMQRDREVIETFMTDLLGAPEGSFEKEDAVLILKTLRNMVARAKGQKTGEAL